MEDGILIFGSLGGSDTVTEHRRNVEPEKINARLAFDLRYLEYCISALQEFAEPGDSPSVLSLGCGLGFDIPEYVRRGYDAHGIDVIDLSPLWRENLGENAWRCVVSDDGRLPFPDNSFDLITSVNVFEHVGTIAPKELITDKTGGIRKNFIRQAIKALKPGGVFVLTCPNRAYPFDTGHTHWYVDDSTDHFAKHGFTLADPFDPRNFLPSIQDIVAICDEISTDMPVSLKVSSDPYLFGEGSPASSYFDYQARLSRFAKEWSDSHFEPVQSAMTPSIQAFIVKEPAPAQKLVDLGGEWQITLSSKFGRPVWHGKMTRQALHSRFFVQWTDASTGNKEGDILDVVERSASSVTLKSYNSTLSLTVNVSPDGRISGKSDRLNRVTGRITRGQLLIPQLEKDWIVPGPRQGKPARWLERAAQLIGRAT